MSSSHKKQPTGDYPIGYCRPPVETRFKKGVSGYPRDRPRRARYEGMHALMFELLSRKIDATRDGRKARISILDVFATKLVHDLTTGSARDRRALFRDIERLGWFNPPPNYERGPSADARQRFLEELAEYAAKSENDRP